MAWASIGSLGRVSDKVAGTTIVLTTSAALEVEHVAVVLVCKDETGTGTTDGDFNEITGVTDSAGNVYTKVAEFANVQTSAAGDGIVIAVFFTKATVQLALGGTITATFSASTTASSISAWEFTIAVGAAVAIQSFTTLANDAADPGSMNLSPPSAEYLWVRAIGAESGDGTNLTPTTSFTTFDGDSTAGGADDSNTTILGEFRIFTGTSNASDPTWVTGKDLASIYAALSEYKTPYNPWYQRAPILAQ